MKVLFSFLMIFYIPFALGAPDISDADVGMYFTLGQERQVYYRLSNLNGKLLLQDKEPGGPISKIHCHPTCEYTKATNGEIEVFFPTQLREGMDLTCIKNSAWAFCRANPKTSPNTNMYALIALFSTPPAFIPLMRAPNHQPHSTVIQRSPALQ